jgi:hypothetical protein
MWGSGGIAPLFLASVEVIGQLHTKSALPLGKNVPVPIEYKGEWAGLGAVDSEYSLASAVSSTFSTYSKC